MGFSACIAEPYIWIWEINGKWEYVAVYVDDLAFALHDPKSFVKLLKDKYKYKLKGTGEIAFHLG